MKIAVAGSSGLIGSALLPALRSDRHEVLRLVRRPPQAADEMRWDPRSGIAEAWRLDDVDAVINLAGAGLGDKRWTEAYKREVHESRVRATTTISKVMAALPARPRVLLSASAIGWYGDTGSEPVDENAPPAHTFIAETVQAWEAATAEAEAAGIRVVHLRSGLVVAASGGAWGRLFPLFRLGLGGRLGSGRQYWSFVALADEVRAIRFLLAAADIRGPVNLTAPNPATNAEVTRVMGRILRRPTVFAVPAPAIRLVLGEFSTEVLASQRVVPRRLLDAGFEFRHPDIEAAVRAAVSVREQ